MGFLPGAVEAQGVVPGFKIEPGFEIVEFADSKLANDIVCMTVDPQGRVIVSGRGYIRILVDDNGDGKADRAHEFSREPKDGAMGLHWEGRELFVTGDGGLRRFTSKTGEKADGPSTLLRAFKTGGEHAAHAIRRGPDGWLYVLCGNNTGIDRTFADLPTSPIKEPIAGCVLRFQPDLKKCEIVAHGFRNPYGMDFNFDGELFTYDSDNERCVSLPWYEPTRFYHVIEGRHYGWLNPQHAVFWRRPPYFCDVVSPIATLGRGSPTGVACYRHNQFPLEYQGGFFLCDWTFGKVYFVKTDRQGATYRAEPRVFLQSIGESGFAPTACAVDPMTGDLYVSIGGRGTRGGVYRIRHPERFQIGAKLPPPSRMAARSLEWTDATKSEYEKKLKSDSAADHLRALQIARRQNSFVGEGGVTSPFETRKYFDDLCVRQALADLIGDLLHVTPPRHREAFRAALKNNVQLAQTTSFGLGVVGTEPAAAIDAGVNLLRGSKLPERRLEGVRLIQLGLGDIGARKRIGTIWEGYSARQEIPEKFNAKFIRSAFPSGHLDLDRELARTLAIVGQGDESLRHELLKKCENDADPLEAIHYLACLAKIPGERATGESNAVASVLLDLDRRITKQHLKRDSNWPLRVRELYAALAARDPALHRAMVDHSSFGRPDHALFATTEGFAKEKAARAFLARWQRDTEFGLTGGIVELLESLPSDEVLPTVRKRWGETGQEMAFLPLLAKKPQAEDRARLVDGLNSPRSDVVSACVEGLNRIGAPSDAGETFALIRALRRIAADPKIGKGTLPPASSRVADLLAKRLEVATAKKYGTDARPWIAWLEVNHPELANRLTNPDGVDVAKWNQRLAAVEWETGDANAGKAVYARAGCVHCHSGSQALGPDLVGVTSRFSRADLFTAIVQPSKDVPARYQTTVVETATGKMYQGIVIYDAVDSLILQTGAAQTVRLDGQDVIRRRVSAQSLMPAGLLDSLSNRDVADLYAYLRNPK